MIMSIFNKTKIHFVVLCEFAGDLTKATGHTYVVFLVRYSKDKVKPGYARVVIIPPHKTLEEGTDLGPLRYKRCAEKMLEYARDNDPNKPIESKRPLLKTQKATLFRSDVDLLDTGSPLYVRVNVFEDQEVKRLYHMYKSL
jgi:hypothetical protein